MTAERKELALVGVRHSKDGRFAPVENNYRNIKQYLEDVNPAFVTLEIPLYRSEVRMWLRHFFMLDANGLNTEEITLFKNQGI